MKKNNGTPDAPINCNRYSYATKRNHKHIVTKLNDISSRIVLKIAYKYI